MMQLFNKVNSESRIPTQLPSPIPSRSRSNSLITDIKNVVVQFLTYREVAILSETCKSWNVVCTSEELWQRYYQEAYGKETFSISQTITWKHQFRLQEEQLLPLWNFNTFVDNKTNKTIEPPQTALFNKKQIQCGETIVKISYKTHFFLSQQGLVKGCCPKEARKGDLSLPITLIHQTRCFSDFNTDEPILQIPDIYYSIQDKARIKQEKKLKDLFSNKSRWEDIGILHNRSFEASNKLSVDLCEQLSKQTKNLEEHLNKRISGKISRTVAHNKNVLSKINYINELATFAETKSKIICLCDKKGKLITGDVQNSKENKIEITARCISSIHEYMLQWKFSGEVTATLKERAIIEVVLDRSLHAVMGNNFFKSAAPSNG